MTKAVLNAISGVDIYAVLSLGLFMSFFIGMLIWPWVFVVLRDLRRKALVR